MKNPANKPNQRKGSRSNTHVGKEFEASAMRFFESQGIHLHKDKEGIEIGVPNEKKETTVKRHRFDLIDDEKQTIVECKAHTWTEGTNVPSAKITAWNAAMYFFHLVRAKNVRKIMFVQRDLNKKTKKTLAEYYIRLHSHLIPHDVEFWEYDIDSKSGRRLIIREQKSGAFDNAPPFGDPERIRL